MDETNEFLASAGTAETVTTVESVAVWARRLVGDGGFRDGVERAAKEGRLSVSAFRWLTDQARTVAEQDQKAKATKRLVDACTPTELSVLVNVILRATGEPERGILVPGTNKYLRFDEMLAIVTEVYRG